MIFILCVLKKLVNKFVIYIVALSLLVYVDYKFSGVNIYSSRL